MMWSVLLPQLLSLAVRFGVVVQVASTSLETYSRLKGHYELRGPARKGFRVRGRILVPHIPSGSVSGSLWLGF
jgi:hypothetical protein